jgi:hypothetical protein
LLRRWRESAGEAGPEAILAGQHKGEPQPDAGAPPRLEVGTLNVMKREMALALMLTDRSEYGRRAMNRDRGELSPRKSPES